MRIKNNNRIGQVPESVLVDPRIGLREKGLYALLSAMDGEETTITALAKLTKDGSDGIKSAIKELVRVKAIRYSKENDVMTIRPHNVKETPIQAAKLVWRDEVIRTVLYCKTFFPDHLLPADFEGWYDTVDKLNRIDKVPFDAIKSITKAAREDKFWSKNFLSLTKLRKKNDDGIFYIVVFAENMKKVRPDIGEILQKDLKGWD